MKYYVRAEYESEELCFDEDEVSSSKGAAKKFFEGGDWGEEPGTVYVTVEKVDDEGYIVDEQGFRFTVYPPEPPCLKDPFHPLYSEKNIEGHDWQRPYEVVGGLKENPGVQGHGGGVIITEVCSRCGMYKITDTWASDHHGQPYEKVTYRDPDEFSLAWVEKIKKENSEDDDE